jgi:hypothetical protein
MAPLCPFARNRDLTRHFSRIVAFRHPSALTCRKARIALVTAIIHCAGEEKLLAMACGLAERIDEPGFPVPRIKLALSAEQTGRVPAGQGPGLRAAAGVPVVRVRGRGTRRSSLVMAAGYCCRSATTAKWSDAQMPSAGAVPANAADRSLPRPWWGRPDRM